MSNSSTSQEKKVLVTGAAGFIGSHTVDLLLAEGHQVHGVDDLSTGSLANLRQTASNPNFELTRDDITRPNLINDLVADFKPDSIIHLAGLVSVTEGQKRPQSNFRLNTESTQLVAEAAREHGCNRIVFASSAAVYGDLEQLPITEDCPKDPKSNYGTAKLMSEMLLLSYAKSYGMTCVCNRFFNVFGPRQDPKSPYSGVISIFADRFSSSRQAMIYGDGLQSRDFVSVFDIARGNVLGATKDDVPSGAYNLCTGRSQSLLELVEALRVHFPSAPEVQHEADRDGDIRHSQGSNLKAQLKLGFAPEVSFGAGIKGLVDSLKTGHGAQMANAA